MILAVIAMTRGQAAILGLLAVAAVLWAWGRLIEHGGPGRWGQDGPDCDGDR